MKPTIEVRKIVAAALFLAIAAGLSRAADPTSDLKNADQGWAKAAEAKNLDQFMSYVADDSYLCGPDGKWIHGKAAVRDVWSKIFADPVMKLSWAADTAGISKDGHLGYTRGTFQGSMGGKPIAGSYATVWEKEKDGKWRATVDIASLAQ